MEMFLVMLALSIVLVDTEVAHLVLNSSDSNGTFALPVFSSELRGV